MLKISNSEAHDQKGKSCSGPNHSLPPRVMETNCRHVLEHSLGSGGALWSVRHVGGGDSYSFTEI